MTEHGAEVGELFLLGEGLGAHVDRAARGVAVTGVSNFGSGGEDEGEFRGVLI